MGITSFDRTSTEVHDWIRALTRPYPGAFAHLAGEKVTLWRAQVVHERGSLLPPGTVLGVHDDGVVVTTRTGAIRLLEVQAGDEAAEPAPTWFARKGIRPGCVFDTVDEATLAWALGMGPRPDVLTGVAVGGAGTNPVEGARP